MIPHIVFANGVDGYFPGPARWALHRPGRHAPAARRHPGSPSRRCTRSPSQRILDHSRRHGRTTRAVAEEFLDRRWADLVRWHRWLAQARDLDGTRPDHAATTAGSPAWTTRRAGTRRTRMSVAGDMPPYPPRGQRRRHRRLSAARDREYDRYMWLVEEMKSAGYDDELLAEDDELRGRGRVRQRRSSRWRATCSPTIGEDHSRPHADVRELRGWADRFRTGVVATTDARCGAARDFDLRSGRWIATETIAMFAPLLCGGLPARRSARCSGCSRARDSAATPICGTRCRRRPRRCRGTSGPASTGVGRCGR